MLQKALYEEGATPRMKPREIENYTTRVIPVEIIAGKRPAGKR
jgi:hypothetical protein